jgi:hypothetical protein
MEGQGGGEAQGVAEKKKLYNISEICLAPTKTCFVDFEN